LSKSNKKAPSENPRGLERGMLAYRPGQTIPAPSGELRSDDRLILDNKFFISHLYTEALGLFPSFCCTLYPNYLLEASTK